MESRVPASPRLTRVQKNWLAVSERRLLTWLCGMMPASITPDRLTAIGMVGAALVFVGYLGSNLATWWLWIALLGYVVQWFGDSLDGSLARFRGIERPSYGYFLDHSCDGAANLLIVAGIGLSPFVDMTVAMIAYRRINRLLRQSRSWIQKRWKKGWLNVSETYNLHFGQTAGFHSLFFSAVLTWPGCPQPRGRVDEEARRNLDTPGERFASSLQS